MEILSVLNAMVWTFVLAAIGLTGIYFICLADVIREADRQNLSGAARVRFIWQGARQHYRDHMRWMKYAAIIIACVVLANAALKVTAADVVESLDQRMADRITEFSER